MFDTAAALALLQYGDSAYPAGGLRGGGESGMLLCRKTR